MRALGKLRRGWQTLRTGGVREVSRRLGERRKQSLTEASYQRWIQACDRLTEEDRRGIRDHIQRLERAPLISVLMPTYNTPERWLRKAIDSVLGQLYPHIELCIADDASTDPGTRRVLEEYRARDERIKVVYRASNGHISASSNSALELATGEYVSFLDHDDVLAEDALYRVAVALETDGADIVYTDHDKIDERDRRFDPYFKPEWDSDLLVGQNYLSHLVVYKAALVREVGGFRIGYEGSQDHDLALRVVERTVPERIRHVPHVLYHWRAVEGSIAASLSAKPYAPAAARRAIEEHFSRSGLNATVTPAGQLEQFWLVHYTVPSPPPLVTLIISTRDNPRLLRRCLESIRGLTTYPSFELLIADNGSRDPETMGYLEDLRRRDLATVLRVDEPFTLAGIHNRAVARAAGDVVVLMDDDVEVITPGWLDEMVGHACRPEVGAVGAMLYYPDDTIQHAGVILWGEGVAVHPYRHQPRGAAGQKGRAWLCQGLSAVTAACLAVRRAVYLEVGGMDERNLSITYNDVDLCLRMREHGYRIVWTPAAELYHRGSGSSGSDKAPENLERFEDEVRYMRRHWGEALLRDPAYNCNLSLETEPFALAFPPRSTKPWLASSHR